MPTVWGREFGYASEGRPALKLPFFLRNLGVTAVRNPLPGFDPIYYHYWYRDSASFGAGPMVHYLTYGWKEGRDPSAGFSTSGYLEANPDVTALKMNPLLHFLEYGPGGRTTRLAEGPEPAGAPSEIGRRADEALGAASGLAPRAAGARHVRPR